MSILLGLPEPGFGGDPTSPLTGPVPPLAELIEILFLMVEGLAFALIFGIPITVLLGIVGGLVLVAIRRRFLGDSENHSTESE